MSQLATKLFEQIGIRTGKIRGRNNDELEISCPNRDHKDRHLGNCYVNLSSGLWHCFSCNAKGIIHDLPLNGLTVSEFNAAWNMVKKEEHFDLKYLNLDLVDYYYHKGLSGYAINRGIYKSTLIDYSVCSDEHDNPIFFIRDFGGQYVACWKREYGQYYLMEPDDSKTRGHLFGMHLPPTKATIVTEGFFDAMNCYQDTLLKSVCLSGTWITEKQKENLAKMQPLYLMPDGDKAGRRARNIWFEMLYDLEVYFCGGYRCDPDELTSDEKANILLNAKSRMEYWEVYEKSRSVV